MKIFFASAESRALSHVLSQANIKYALFSGLNIIKRRYLYKKKETPYELPRKNLDVVTLPFKETIMDSGLYSMMFGVYRGLLTSIHDAHLWYDSMIETIYEYKINSTIVECDFQKIFPPDVAWQFRYQMRKDLPNHQIINVWHFEDGEKGFERLLEFSDYLGIGVPEWRKHRPKSYKKYIIPLGQKIVAKGKKLHYLGCTEFTLLKDINFATSCDSTAWLYSSFANGFRERHGMCPEDSRIRLLASTMYYDEKIRLLGKINED